MCASSYTLSGCDAAASCGVFVRVPARCTDATYGRCPGGEYANGNTDPALCDGAPVYQQPGDGGLVLLRVQECVPRITGSPSCSSYTQWLVLDSSALADCGGQAASRVSSQAIIDSGMPEYLLRSMLELV